MIQKYQGKEPANVTNPVSMLGLQYSGYSPTFLIVDLNLCTAKTWFQQSLLLKAQWESRCTFGSVPAPAAVQLYS